mmetsp:Transcript_27745/g.92817  ORF Transcript_27745/g.92817 Transcript_27745/m.92817 type:complete len:216 (+) Transcript_27745:502-1149(+)
MNLSAPQAAVRRCRCPLNWAQLAISKSPTQTLLRPPTRHPEQRSGPRRRSQGEIHVHELLERGGHMDVLRAQRVGRRTPDDGHVREVGREGGGDVRRLVHVHLRVDLAAHGHAPQLGGAHEHLAPVKALHREEPGGVQRLEHLLLLLVGLHLGGDDVHVAVVDQASEGVKGARGGRQRGAVQQHAAGRGDRHPRLCALRLTAARPTRRRVTGAPV